MNISCAAFTPSFPCRSVFYVSRSDSPNHTLTAVNSIIIYWVGLSNSGLLVRHRWFLRCLTPVLVSRWEKRVGRCEGQITFTISVLMNAESTDVGEKTKIVSFLSVGFDGRMKD